MATLTDNINSLLRTKSKFANILTDNEVPIPATFEEFPDAMKGLISEDNTEALELTEDILGK